MSVNILSFGNMLRQIPCLPNFPQESEFAPRVTEEWAVTQEVGIKEKQNWDESKTKRRLCNRTLVSFLVLETVAVYLLVAVPIGLDRAPGKMLTTMVKC